MCGRYALAQSPSVYADWFDVDAIETDGIVANFNVAPTDEVYVVAEHESRRRLGTMRWGLIPHFATDRRGAASHINARKETVADKPSYRTSFRRRRCLVPADGFYEWERQPDGTKLPHYFFDPGGHPLAFAGLWASWRDPEKRERVSTCTILTGDPDPVVAPVHNRTPVILPADRWDGWLDPREHDRATLLALLDGARAKLEEYAVSTLVNDVRNNLPELIEPLPPHPGRSGHSNP